MNHPSDDTDGRPGDGVRAAPGGRQTPGLRIATLAPSLTELAFALGLGPWVVARTGYCIHPMPQVGAVPKVGGTKTVNLRKLARLAPTQAWINVDENPRELHDALCDLGIRPVVTHPLGPEDHAVLVDTVVQALADWPAVQAAARAAGVALQAQVEAALAATRPEGRRPERVLYLIWRDPWMTVARDTHISRLLARVGWATWPPVEGGPAGAARYPVVRGDEPWLAGIERVLLSSEPFTFGDADAKAVQAMCPAARVEPIDGEAIGWWGPRMIEGLRLLRERAAPAGAPPGAPPDNAPWT